MGMTEMITGSVVGILSVISIFMCGFEFGKMMGLHKAEKLLDEVIERNRRANDGWSDFKGGSD